MNKNLVESKSDIEKLLDECKIQFFFHDCKKLIELCEEVFKLSPDNQIAIGYESIAYLELKLYDEVMELLDKGCRLYPDNYYLKNNRAMLYYELGEYEKSLRCCEEGLKIKDFDWLCENKVKVLIKLERTDEAIEFYQSQSPDFSLEDLLIEGEKFAEALDYYFDKNPKNCSPFIDRLKDSIIENDLKMPPQLDDYYINWIYKIRGVNITQVCPDCGGDLIPIIYGFPSSDLVGKAENGEVFLGGSGTVLNNFNYHCRKCGHEFHLKKSKVNDYAEYKINELISNLKIGSLIISKPLDNLKDELKGFDESEFNFFMDYLKEINFIYEPEKGYVRLVGFKDMKCAKQY